MSLPQFMVMRSNVSGKYLRYGKGTGRSTRSSSLSFSHEVERPSLDTLVASESFKTEKTPLEFHLLKFEVEEAKNASEFVHIRTCYNHKYLVRKSEESKSLVAEADEAEEDQLKWSCTLFKPVFLCEVEEEEEEGKECVYGSNKHGIGMRPHKIQLLHLLKGEEVYYVSESMELIKKEEAIDEFSLKKISMLTISDVTATVQLPKYLTFKCHDGTKYLGSPDWHYLYFRYTDMADQGVAMVNLNSDTGPTSVSIYSGHGTNGGDWTPNDLSNIVVCPNSPWKFSPVKVNNFVALYLSYNQTFLARESDKLVNKSPNISEEAQLQIGESVLSRTILKITYDLENARVYDTTSVTKITDSRSNHTNHQDTGSLSREFGMSHTMTWNQSITVGMSMSMKLSVGIPELGFGEEVSINYDISGTCTWGEETSQTETITHLYNFDVPPMTKQTKSMVASRSSCDVPFTCDVDDLLVDGTTRKYTITDCWFTGANDYDATEETYEEPLTAS